jgi:hypothetical protein
MRTAIEDPDDDRPRETYLVGEHGPEIGGISEGFTVQRGRQYELDDAPGGYATGGPVQAAEPWVVGEQDRCCHRVHTEPVNITVHVHGSVLAEQDIARIIREQLGNYRRRNQRPPEA